MVSITLPNIEIPGFTAPSTDQTGSSNAGTNTRRNGALAELNQFEAAYPNWSESPELTQAYNDRVRNYILWEASYRINQGEITSQEELEAFFRGTGKLGFGNIEDFFTDSEIQALMSEGFEGIEDRAEFLEDYATRLNNQINMERQMQTLIESGIYPELKSGIALGGDAAAIAEQLGFDYQRPSSMEMYGMQSDRWQAVSYTHLTLPTKRIV